MQFFQPPERQRLPDQPPVPEWIVPPIYEVGEPVPARGVVARSDSAAVVLQGVVVFRAWVWPLPPPAPFDLVCEWPGLGIPLTRHAIDGAAIRTAAALSVPLWEPDPQRG
jgi:hypothetical protein